MTVDLDIAELKPDKLARARAVLIAGPTASGKSALAMSIAEFAVTIGYEPTIVNADSMQVYDGLRILTARPSRADERAVPHRFYGHVAPEERYSVGRWLDDIGVALRRRAGDEQINGALAILVGGTGLYFRALTTGLADIPAIPETTVAAWQARLKAEGAERLHQCLAAEDPVGASKLSPTDPQRLVRALSVLTATGRPLHAWHAAGGKPVIDPADTVRLVVMPDRDRHGVRIRERVEAMVAGGVVDETEAFLARGLDPDLPAMKAIGLKEFGACLGGRTSLEAAMAQVAIRTGQYAKRQRTWARGQMADWNVITTD